MVNDHIYLCPRCNGKIHVSGGANEYYNFPIVNRIRCFECNHWFSVEVDLTDITEYIEDCLESGKPIPVVNNPPEGG